MTRALLLFARSPETEARSKGLPLPGAAALFSRIAVLWSEAAKSSGARLFISTDSAQWTSGGSPTVFLQQRSSAFGIRLADAVEQAFAAGATALIIAGIDTPPPDPSTLEEAFRHLEGGGHDASVIGPASDGGIYLLGVTRFDRDLLEGIKPRQRDVVQHCRRFFSKNSVLHLPVTTDLDSLRDAQRLRRRPETVWLGLHPLLTSMLGREFFAPDKHVPFSIERKSLRSRAPPRSYSLN